MIAIIARWRSAGDEIAYVREPATPAAVSAFADWAQHYLGYSLPAGYLALLSETDGCQVENSILSGVTRAIRDNTSHEALLEYEQRLAAELSKATEPVFTKAIEWNDGGSPESMLGKPFIIGTNGNVDKFLIQPDGTLSMVDYFDVMHVFESFPATSRFLERLVPEAP